MEPRGPRVKKTEESSDFDFRRDKDTREFKSGGRLGAKKSRMSNVDVERVKAGLRPRTRYRKGPHKGQYLSFEDQRALDSRYHTRKFRSAVTAKQRYWTLNPDTSVDERLSELSDMQRAYSGMMLMACMEPFQNENPNIEDVVKAATMAAMFMSFDKDFRLQTRSVTHGVKNGAKEVIYNNRVKRKIDNPRKRIDRKLDALESKKTAFVNDAASMSDTDFFMKQMKKFDEKEAKLKADRHRIDIREQGRKDTFTRETAALTLVGLVQGTSLALRDSSNKALRYYSSVDPDGKNAKAYSEYLRDSREKQISQFEDTYNKLKECAEFDGLDFDEVEKTASAIIASEISEHPELGVYYDGVNSGRYSAVNKKDPLAENASFRDTGTHQSVTGGFFMPSEPKTPKEWEDIIARNICSDLVKTLDNNGSTEFEWAVSQYMATLKDPHEVTDLPSDPTVDPRADARFKSIQTISDSMSFDGIESDSQRSIYRRALMTALCDGVQAERPDEILEYSKSHAGWTVDDYRASYLRSIQVKHPELLSDENISEIQRHENKKDVSDVSPDPETKKTSEPETRTKTHQSSKTKTHSGEDYTPEL